MHFLKAWGAVGLVGLVGLGAGSCGSSSPDKRVDAGSDAGAGAGSYTLGAFKVVVSSDGELSVSHEALPERVLFATVAGASFVEAWAVADTLTERAGSFTIDEQVDARCDQRRGLEVTQSAQRLELSTTLLCDKLELPVQLSFEAKDDTALGFTLRFEAPSGSALNQAVLVYAAEENERFVGFGEQFTYLDLRGQTVPVLVQEGGIGRAPGGIADLINMFSPGSGGSWASTYAPAPYYLTDRGRSLMLENSELSWFDLTAVDRVKTRARSNELRGRILFGQTPLDVVRAFTSYTGRMAALPDWINQGAVVGMQGGTARVREVLAQLEASSTPLAAFWLQDWVGKRATPSGSRLWWNWQLNQTQYPGWTELVDELAQKSIRVMTYVNPYLVDVTGDPAFTRNLYAEAREQGFLVKDQQGDPYVHVSGTFDAGIVDLTNPEAFAWLKAVIRDEVLGVGASGYMADFGEALPFDASIAVGDVAVVHNQYPELWAKLNRELVQEEKREGDVVFFMRGGFTKSPGLASLFWLGDQNVSWDADDGLASALTGMLSGGLSGYSLNHSDIGGYTAFGPLVRTQEVLLRWMELNAFTAVYRTHEGSAPDANAQLYDDETSLAQFAKFAKVYAALAPYRKELMKQASESGAPLARHLLLEYPDDPKAWEQGEEFMLGRDVLVAPVLAPATTKVTAYLPAGEWVHLWSGKAYNEAGSYEIEAPIGQPAVFYRAGSTAGEALEALTP